MRNRSSLNNFLNRDRKTLYMVLLVLVLSVFTLTMAYAALSTTLNITGNAEVTAANWDIHFDNIQINSGSVEVAKTPTITDSKTINFAVGLEEPGDYYKFTVDIVNEGTIDAMIDSVVKTPELTEAQAKYIKYEIEYTDGNAISSKQLLPKDSTKTMSVLVAYRSDVSPTDIPTEGESLNLSFTMIYTQADETGTEIPEGVEIKVVSGDVDTVGSEISIGDEHFYIISSDDSSVTMLAKYNLYVGKHCTSGSACTAYGDEATGIQDPTMIGYPTDGSYPRDGTIAFSSTNYWSSTTSSYPVYVFDSNSNLYTPVENYKTHLESMGVTIEEARLIKQEELVSLGCSVDDLSCSSSSYTWTYSTSYWTGSAYSSVYVWSVVSDVSFGNSTFSYDNNLGVRPVIVIAEDQITDTSTNGSNGGSGDIGNVGGGNA